MQDSQEALVRINRWDKLYKTFVALTIVVTTLIAVSVLVQIYIVNSHLQSAITNSEIAIKDSHKINTENNTYLRLNACIVSVPPQRRTPEYVKSCYDDADQFNKTMVYRYGDGK